MKQAERELSELDTQIAPLLQLREDLACQWNEHKALLSPVRSLAPELVAEIFLHCLPEDPRPLISQAPLLLCRVCSRWRSIALSTPRLWCSIRVIVDGNATQATSTLDSWIRRAGICPLDIRMQLDGSSEHLLHDLVDTAISASFYWRRLYMTNIPQSCATRICDIPSQSLPLLEDITLESRSLLESDSPTGFRFAPRLHKISLIGNAARTRSLFVNYPLRQLTELTLLMPADEAPYSTDDYLKIFFHCPNLAVCKIGSYSSIMPDDTVSLESVIVTMQLVELTLTTKFPEKIGPLFNRLVLPRLGRISLRALRCQNGWPKDALMDLLHRSSLSLERPYDPIPWGLGIIDKRLIPLSQ